MPAELRRPLSDGDGDVAANGIGVRAGRNPGLDHAAAPLHHHLPLNGGHELHPTADVLPESHPGLPGDRRIGGRGVPALLIPPITLTLLPGLLLALLQYLLALTLLATDLVQQRIHPAVGDRVELRLEPSDHLSNQVIHSRNGGLTLLLTETLLTSAGLELLCGLLSDGVEQARCRRLTRLRGWLLAWLRYLLVTSAGRRSRSLLARSLLSLLSLLV